MYPNIRLIHEKDTLENTNLNFDIGIFQEDSLSPVLFSMAQMTLTIEFKHRYTIHSRTRSTHSEDIEYHDTGNVWTLATVPAWKNSINATVGGVGILIGPRALKSQNNIERIQPWMMVATFNDNPRATIISCYSPANVSEETEPIAFYDELSSLEHSIPKYNVLVIVGNMNAQIGKNGNHKYSLHNSSNRNGQHLTYFPIENRLTCLNTNFRKMEGKLSNYTYANNTKALIYYVFINKQ